jgi:TrmH family RNA methyltransferase
MLSTAQRANMTVVLVGARNPHNIGAAARAMHDFGFSELRIVNDFAAPFEAAQLEAAANSAIAAQSVLDHAHRFDTLAEAIADCTLIVATTAVGAREITQSILPLQEASPLLLGELSAGRKVALLFGSEKTGLTNEQLSYANLLTTIPMYEPGAAADGKAARHLSMNLGQAVAVCLYELTRTGFEGAKELPELQEAAPTAQDRELLTQLLLNAMQSTGYARRFPANAGEATVRRLVQQLGTSHREAMTWMGILRQVLWNAQQEPRTASESIEPEQP